MPDGHDLAQLYLQAWGSPNEHFGETGGTDGALAALYARRLLRNIGRGEFRGLRLLDFGAGRGSMVNALVATGASCCAVEPFGVSYLKTLGIEAYRSIEELPPGSEFDGILAMDVLEHVPFPWIALRGLRGILRSGGWLCVATPNPTCASARLRGGRWTDAANLSHLMLFRPRVLRSMLHDAGFERIRRLRWFVPHWEGTARRWLGYVLQGTSTDGVVRYLAWAPGP